MDLSLKLQGRDTPNGAGSRAAPASVLEANAVPSRSWTNQAARSATIAGVLLVLAGFGILMGIISAEALYPDIYTTHDNEISDLGATRPPDSVILQPSARIFDGTMILAGAAVIAATAGLHTAFHRRGVTIPVGLMGIGILGVGIFPGNYGSVHSIFALTAFVAGGIAGVLTAQVQSPPSNHLSRLLGAIALGALVVGMLGDVTPLWHELGDGGVERWIAYPVIVWMIAFGAYLLPRREVAR